MASFTSAPQDWWLTDSANWTGRDSTSAADLKNLRDMAMQNAVVPPYFSPSTSPNYSTNKLQEMVEMRLRKSLKFDHIHAYKHKEEFVHFLIWVKGELVTLKDDWGLFPSDQLITQIRLLETQ